MSDTILAFDIENEPMIASPDILAANDPGNWLCGRATAMRSVLGSSAVKVATGGIGGSQYDGHEYNLLSAALKCDAIDIMSVHGYMTKASQWQEFFPSLATQGAAAGKLVMVEEWGVGTGSGYDSPAVQSQVFDAAGVPWVCSPPSFPFSSS